MEVSLREVSKAKVSLGGIRSSAVQRWRTLPACPSPYDWLLRFSSLCVRGVSLKLKAIPAVWKQSLREEIRLITFHSSNRLSYWWFSSAVPGLDHVLLLFSQGSPLDGAEQATTLRWATVQMGAVSNISDHWGTLAANRPLRNPWFIICNRSYTLIFSPAWVKDPKQTVLRPYQQKHLLGSGPKLTDAKLSPVKCFVLFPDEVHLHPVKSFELFQWVYIYKNVNKKTVMDAVVKRIP